MDLKNSYFVNFLKNGIILNKNYKRIKNMDFAKIISTIEAVQHPAINASLTTLGILQNVDIVPEENKVTATFAWPFEGIPVRDMLINSVSQSLKNLNINFEFDEKIMNEEEKQKFLQIEKANWKGM